MDGRFKNRLAYELFCGAPTRRFPGDVRIRAQNKLKFLYSAARLEDMAFPPGNRLEPLRGHRKGQHSIRINDQWQICFRWVDGQAQDIEITDYH